MGDILQVEILPYDDPVVVPESMEKRYGKRLKVLLNCGLHNKGKSAEALRYTTTVALIAMIFRRFPAISGFRMTWDSLRDPVSRVLSMRLLKPKFSSKEALFQVDEEPIETQFERVAGGRMYKIVTAEYMAKGHGGFSTLIAHQGTIDH